MAEVPTGEYVYRSIDQLRSMNERSTLGAVIHDYKQFSDLRNNVVTDYTIKNSLNNNNNLIDNRNTISSHNQSPVLDQKHHIQQQYTSASTPPTPLSITDAQMNDAKVSWVNDWGFQSKMRKLFWVTLRIGWNQVENEREIYLPAAPETWK